MIHCDLKSILEADFCALAVLISFAVIVGRASISQLIVMALFEVVAQCLNEQIGKNLLMVFYSIRMNWWLFFRFELIIAFMLKGS